MPTQEFLRELARRSPSGLAEFTKQMAEDRYFLGLHAVLDAIELHGEHTLFAGSGDGHAASETNFSNLVCMPLSSTTGQWDDEQRVYFKRVFALTARTGARTHALLLGHCVASVEDAAVSELLDMNSRGGGDSSLQEALLSGDVDDIAELCDRVQDTDLARALITLRMAGPDQLKLERSPLLTAFVRNFCLGPPGACAGHTLLTEVARRFGALPAAVLQARVLSSYLELTASEGTVWERPIVGCMSGLRETIDGAHDSHVQGDIAAARFTLLSQRFLDGRDLNLAWNTGEALSDNNDPSVRLVLIALRAHCAPALALVLPVIQHTQDQLAPMKLVIESDLVTGPGQFQETIQLLASAILPTVPAEQERRGILSRTLQRMGILYVREPLVPVTLETSLFCLAACSPAAAWQDRLKSLLACGADPSRLNTKGVTALESISDEKIRSAWAELLPHHPPAEHDPI